MKEADHRYRYYLSICLMDDSCIKVTCPKLARITTLPVINLTLLGKVEGMV